MSIQGPELTVSVRKSGAKAAFSPGHPAAHLSWKPACRITDHQEVLAKGTGQGAAPLCLSPTTPITPQPLTLEGTAL